MIAVGHAQRGKSPRVLDVGIERHAVVFDGKRSPVTEDFHGAREIVRQERLVLLAPARRAGRQEAGGESDGRHVEARVQAAATVEADFLPLELARPSGCRLLAESSNRRGVSAPLAETITVLAR